MTRTDIPSSDAGRYRRISTRMWGDDKFRQLSRPQPNAQSLWIYLISGPQSGIVPGLYAIGERALTEQLGWPIKGFRKAWRELEALEMVEADWRARVVWVKKSVRHNRPANGNTIKSWRLPLADIPECDLKTRAVMELARICDELGPSFSEAFHEICPSAPGNGSRNGLAIKEQDQDQEQEQEQELGAGRTVARAEAFGEETPSPRSGPTLVRDPDEVLLARFSRFWAMYPNQEQREPARMLWVRMAPSEGVSAEIVAAVEAYRRSPQWADAIATRQLRFIPLAKRFLRDRLWCDAPVIASRPVMSRCPHAPPCTSDVACTQRELHAQLHSAAASDDPSLRPAVSQ